MGGRVMATWVMGWARVCEAEFWRVVRSEARMATSGVEGWPSFLFHQRCQLAKRPGGDAGGPLARRSMKALYSAVAGVLATVMTVPL